MVPGEKEIPGELLQVMVVPTSCPAVCTRHRFIELCVRFDSSKDAYFSNAVIIIVQIKVQIPTE
jgi:hypothetical protein